jgi:tellurite resistance protein
MDKLSQEEILICVMVTMSAVDSEMSDAEMKRMGNITQNLPAFNGFDESKLLAIAQSCTKILQEENGLKTVLELAASLPQKLHETAYALAVEIAAADLKLEQEELRLLQLLRDALGLDKLTVAAIERGARARHQSI